MRLIGYSCKHPEGPLREVHLPLGALTVLLGRNDSGKSSLLRAVERDLRGGHFDDTDKETAKRLGGVFFAQASDQELGSLIREALTLRQRQRERYEGHLGSRPPYGRGRSWVDFRLPDDAADPIAGWLAALESFAATDGFEHVLAALGASRLLALEPAGTDQGQRVWNVYWCLPPLDSLTDEVKDALSVSDVSPFAEEREREQAKAKGKPWFRGGMYGAIHGTPRHLWASGAPVVVAAIGQTRSAHVPRGLAVPTDFASLRVEVANSLNDLVTAARYGAVDAQRDGDPLTPDEERFREIPQNWLDVEGDGWQVHTDARGGAAFIAAAANRLLPRFVSERYRIEVVLRPLPDWFGQAGEALDVRLNEKRSDAAVVDFSIEKAADGLQLWVQLALLEACEQASRVASELRRSADEWWSFEEDKSRAYSAGEMEPGDDLERQADHHEQLLVAMRDDLRSLTEDTSAWLTGELADRLSRPDPDEWTSRLARHRRFFLVDEPERHLHPSLQREAAAWLKATTEQRDAPCLVATHSTPFLGLPSDDNGPLYVFVRREPDAGTICEPFDAGKLRELDDVVGSLGFDRGELLTTVSLFLVVEGIHDVVVLEQAFDELHASRIALLPLEGLSNYQTVLDSDALWRYTTAEVALTTDKFDVDEVRRVVEDANYAKQVRKAGGDEELKLLAKLVGNAERNNKRIWLLGHRGADLIDVLDEKVIQALFPEYPGHAEAHRQWNEAVAAGAKAKQRKSFYEENFKVPATVETYQRLGAEMAVAKSKPPELRAIVEQAVSIAAGRVPSTVHTAAPAGSPTP